MERLRTSGLLEAIAELTPDQRAVVYLRAVADMTVPDIARALDKPETAVKALLRRGGGVAHPAAGGVGRRRMTTAETRPVTTRSGGAVSTWPRRAMEDVVTWDRGDVPPFDDDDDLGLGALEDVMADLRAVAVRPASPEVAADHVARMAAARAGATVHRRSGPALERGRPLLDGAPPDRRRCGGRSSSPSWASAAWAWPGPCPARSRTWSRPSPDRSASTSPAPTTSAPEGTPGDHRYRAAPSPAARRLPARPAGPGPDRLDTRAVGRDPCERSRAPRPERVDARAVRRTVARSERRSVGHRAGSERATRRRRRPARAEPSAERAGPEPEPVGHRARPDAVTPSEHRPGPDRRRNGNVERARERPPPPTGSRTASGRS